METTTKEEQVKAYQIKCDDCKTEIGRTDSIRESAAGGRCEDCRPAAQILGYTIEKVDGDDGQGARAAYMLHGPRGARYALIRSARQPTHLYAWNDRTFRTSSVQGYSWFTDRNGVLEVWA